MPVGAAGCLGLGADGGWRFHVASDAGAWRIGADGGAVVALWARTITRGRFWGVAESKPWRADVPASLATAARVANRTVDGVGECECAELQGATLAPDTCTTVHASLTIGTPVGHDDVVVMRASLKLLPSDAGEVTSIVGWRVDTIGLLPRATAEFEAKSHSDADGIHVRMRGEGVVPTILAVLSLATLAILVWWIPVAIAWHLATTTAAVLAALGVIIRCYQQCAVIASEARLCQRFFYNGWQSFSFAGSLPVVPGASRTTETRMPWFLSGPFHDGARPPPRTDWIGTWLFRRIETPLYGAVGPVARQWRGWIHGHMFGALKPHVDKSACLVYGFLSQHRHYGLASVATDGSGAISLLADGDGALVSRHGGESAESLTTDWAMLHAQAASPKTHGGPPQPFATYVNATAAHARARSPAVAPPPTGWCSWYEMMCEVSEEGVLENARRLRGTVAGLLDVIQLDDGYARRWGDWGTPDAKKFAHGIEALSRRLRGELGYGAGLWMAPFTADTDADIASRQPHFFTRHVGAGGALRMPQPAGGEAALPRTKRKPVEVQQHVPVRGFANSALTHPGKFFLGFDLTNDAAVGYACNCVAGAVAAGYRFLKLDFLHAGALPGARRDPSITRAAAMTSALARLRMDAEFEHSPVYIVGCSCPLGSAVGWADALRVSADASTQWLPGPFPLPHRDKTNLPAMRNVVRNVCTRAMLHRTWFVNNPDCLVLRAESSHSLTEATIMACVSLVVLSGGLVFLSDDVTKLPSDRFRYALKALPALGQAPRPSAGSWNGELTALDLLEKEMPETLVRRVAAPYLRAGGAPARTEMVPYTLVMLAHWSDTPKEVARSIALKDVLAPSDVADAGCDAVAHVLDLWTGTYHMIARDATTGAWEEPLIAPSVLCRSASLMAVHIASPDVPRFLGSDMHASGGAVELQSFSYARGIFSAPGSPVSPRARPPGAVRWSACAVLSLQRDDSGRVWLHLPGCRSPPRVGGDAARPDAPVHRVGACAWCVPVRLHGVSAAWLLLEW